METENVEGKKVAVKGGGVCIYCGWDGGDQGLRDEHVVPYSLGGSTELLNASCSDCEAVTSYLDGYMANAILGHLRVHIDLQSRSGHPETLPATIELADGTRAVDLATETHPYFLNMPIWRPPGFMIGKQLSDGFGEPGKFTYWYVPPNLRSTIRLRDGDIARIIDTSPPHNLNAFARGLPRSPSGRRGPPSCAPFCDMAPSVRSVPLGSPPHQRLWVSAHYSMCRRASAPSRALRPRTALLGPSAELLL
jgi:hypothetical protein